MKSTTWVNEPIFAKFKDYIYTVVALWHFSVFPYYREFRHQYLKNIIQCFHIILRLLFCTAWDSGVHSYHISSTNNNGPEFGSTELLSNNN